MSCKERAGEGPTGWAAHGSQKHFPTFAEVPLPSPKAAGRVCFFRGKRFPPISRPGWHLLLCCLPRTVGEIATNLQNLDVTNGSSIFLHTSHPSLHPGSFSPTAVQEAFRNESERLWKCRETGFSGAGRCGLRRVPCRRHTQSRAEFRVENSCPLSTDCGSTGFSPSPFICVSAKTHP